MSITRVTELKVTQSAIPGLRSQDLVFTLFGDYLLRYEEPVWTGGLIELLGQLGLSAMAVRIVLSRMARKGWLTVERHGTRSSHGLTARGRKLLEAGSERIYHPPQDGKWDGSWQLVAFSVPESRRRLRDQLRTRLTWLGCGSLTPGLWITPHDVRAAVADIAETLRLTRNVEVFSGRHLGFADAAHLVAQCWDLPEINRRYEAFLTRWRGSLDHCRRCGLSGAKAGVHRPCTDGADCFQRRFLLVHEYRTFPLADPYLPHELLPEGWQGVAAATLFQSYHDLLAGPAERYVAGVVKAGHSSDPAAALAAAR